jgi:hypothetical protein
MKRDEMESSSKEMMMMTFIEVMKLTPAVRAVEFFYA